jgi:hypothetical protein
MFVDKRIGEKDASLTAEDKMIARLRLLWECFGSLCLFLPWFLFRLSKYRWLVRCWMYGGRLLKGVNGSRGHTSWSGRAISPQPVIYLLTSWLLLLPNRGRGKSGKILTRGGGRPGTWERGDWSRRAGFVY